MQQVAGKDLGGLYKYENIKAKRKYIVGKINRADSGFLGSLIGVEVEGRFDSSWFSSVF